MFINISGALLLAFVTTLADATFLLGPTRRLFINVGLLGAYTTFSSLALGDVLLFTKGHALAAILYLLLSMVGGIMAVLLGDWLGQACVRKVKRSRLLPFALDETTPAAHVDVQDDLLLPDHVDELETR
ncbi:MAG: hypothetical protein NVS4B7_00480 [Ktedonobacteraceae bacterium]